MNEFGGVMMQGKKRRIKSFEKRKKEVEEKIKEIINIIGIDINNPHIKETPRRISEMLFNEIFSSVTQEKRINIKVFPNEEKYDQIIATKVKFYSMCAHHFLPFFGVAYVGYVPGEYYVGLSKLARIVYYFARKPQTQEKLTEEVSNYINEVLKPRGVMVVVKARHLCMEMRGVKNSSETVTSSIKGCFIEKNTRDEFLELIKKMEGR